ncbi:MAG: asparagine synthase-related protein, partial [Xanthomarina sp.]
EFCMNLHPDLKLHGLNEKYLLKKMMAGRLPDEILNRPKQAYRAPIRSLFVSEELPDYLKTMLSEDCIKEFGVFNTEHVKTLHSKIRSNKEVSEIDNMAMTAVLSIQILYDLFVKKSIPELSQNDLITLDKIIIE